MREMSATHPGSRGGRRPNRLVIALGAGLLVAAACSGSDEGEAAGQADAPDGGTPAAWAHHGNDLANTRTAPDETTLGPDNVDRLRPVWSTGDVDGVSGTPIVADGTVYVGDWTSHVRALDAATGEELWSHDLDAYYVGGSVAVTDDRVFVGTFDGRIVALDRGTGEQDWEADLDEHPQSVVFGSPVAVEGLVVVGVGSFEVFAGGEDPSFRGHIMALDAETGEEEWNFFVTRGDETEGPGVSVWSSPAIDLERGHLYIGTGQAYAPPAPPRSDAVVALDLRTGEEVWHRQFTEGDAWTLAQPTGLDADVGASPNLFQVDGVDAVGVGDKDGVYRALDRETGEVLWEHRLTEGGLQGGVMASATVEGGRIFVASNRANRDADLVALDADTGDELWRVDVEAHVTGPLTWANGVIYFADDDGRIGAHAAEDGERLWSHEVEAPAAGGVAVVDGTVYAGYGWWLAGAPEDPRGALVAFRLDGEGAAGVDGGSEETATGDGDEPRTGEKVYAQTCAVCHGGSGEGASGPSLVGVTDRLDRDEHVAIVREGRGEMPAWEDQLEPEEIEAVVDYEREVLDGG